MPNAIIIHGMPGKVEYYDPSVPSASNHHWVPWLQKQLLVHEINTATPEIPHAFKPEYDVWKREFERFDIGAETNLIGHSCGGGFLVRWLSEHKSMSVRNVVLVAPWIDPFREDTSDFFDFEIDEKMAKRTKRIIIFDSNNDSNGVHTSVGEIREKIHDIEYRQFNDYGHFTVRGMGTSEFPELLEAVLS